MEPIVLVVFLAVYLGMVLGRLPGLSIDRTGVALLGAIALVAARRVSPQEAWSAIDVPTVALLLGLMVVSAQLRLGGFYSEVARRLASAPAAPSRLLAGVIGSAAALSPVLANDVVCLARTPVLAVGCLRRGLRPEPFLLALSSTLAGNPLLLGSIANLIVAEHAGRLGIRIGWRQHARVGVPVTAATLAIAAGWLAVRGLLAPG